MHMKSIQQVAWLPLFCHNVAMYPCQKDGPMRIFTMLGVFTFAQGEPAVSIR